MHVAQKSQQQGGRGEVLHPSCAGSRSGRWVGKHIVSWFHTATCWIGWEMAVASVHY